MKWRDLEIGDKFTFKVDWLKGKEAEREKVSRSKYKHVASGQILEVATFGSMVVKLEDE